MPILEKNILEQSYKTCQSYDIKRFGKSQESTTLWLDSDQGGGHTQIHETECVKQCDARLVSQQVCQASIQKNESLNRERYTQFHESEIAEQCEQRLASKQTH